MIVGNPGRVDLTLSELPADDDLYLVDGDGGIVGRSVQEGIASEQLQLTMQRGRTTSSSRPIPLAL